MFTCLCISITPPMADVIYRLPSAGAAKTILRSTSSFQPGGFSWVLIDAEHGLISDRDYYEVCSSTVVG